MKVVSRICLAIIAERSERILSFTNSYKKVIALFVLTQPWSFCMELEVVANILLHFQTINFFSPLISINICHFTQILK